MLFTRDLRKTQKFYSALGISWLGGREDPLGESGIPVSVEKCSPPYGGAPGVETAGLPDLWGDFNAVEFWFFLQKSLPPVEKIPHIRICLTVENPEKVIENLKAADLYNPDLENSARIKIIA